MVGEGVGLLVGDARGCGCARGPYFKASVLQMLRLKVPRCGAYAASLYAGIGARRVRSRVLFTCVMMLTLGGLPVTPAGIPQESRVNYQQSGSRSDFECLPNLESEIWNLFAMAPAEMWAAISELKIKQNQFFPYKDAHEEVEGTERMFHGTTMKGFTDIHNAAVEGRKFMPPPITLYMRNTIDANTKPGVFSTPVLETALGTYAPSCRGLQVAIAFAVKKEEVIDRI